VSILDIDTLLFLSCTCM